MEWKTFSGATLLIDLSPANGIMHSHIKNTQKKLRVGGDHFEILAFNLMFAVDETSYESCLVNIETFIEEELDERGFLQNWIGWWDRRRSHFANAFKSVNAPNSNLSENFNSKYVSTKEINLKLVDAAGRDAVDFV